MDCWGFPIALYTQASLPLTTRWVYEMCKSKNSQERCDRRNFSPVWLQISQLSDLVPLRHIHVCHEKYRVSTTNVPIFAQIRSGDKTRSIVLDRPYGLQEVNFQYGGNTSIGCMWQSQFISHKTNLVHKIKMCLNSIRNIYLYWISIYPG